MSRPAKNAVKDVVPPIPTAAPVAARLPLLWLLMLLALGEAALSAYQWRELLVVRAGGQTACNINASIHCETVWNSAFASHVHALSGIPVAGLGVVWGLAALVAAGAFAWQARKGGPVVAEVGAVRLVAAAGFLSCITFAVASAQAKALCPTCLLTYVLVAGYTVVAFWKLPGAAVPQGRDLGRSVAWAALPAALAFLALLGPGRATPRAEADGLKALRRVGTASHEAAAPEAPAQPSRPLTQRERQVASFLAGLGPRERQAVADAVAEYRAQPLGVVGGYPVRHVEGDAGAPLKMVEWTDMLCPHCAQLQTTLKELERVLPPGLVSVEARHFPLTSACNPMVPVDRDGEVRCLGAKAQICLEQSKRYGAVRAQLFAEQASLTPGRVWEIASGGMDRKALEACVAAPSTQEKLEQDIRYAMANRLEGTPLVLLNGRKASSYGPFLYVMALLGGDAGSPAFAGLPPPRLPGGGHEGHAH